MEGPSKGLVAYRKKELSDEFYVVPSKSGKKGAKGDASKSTARAEPAPPKERVRCGCSGIEHVYFSNCMGCGRILCMKEGAGPCFHCGTEVFSADDLDKLPSTYANDPEFARACELRDRLLEMDTAFAGEAMKVHDLQCDWFREAHNVYNDDQEYAMQQYLKEQAESLAEAEIRRFDLDLASGSIAASSKAKK